MGNFNPILVLFKRASFSNMIASYMTFQSYISLIQAIEKTLKDIVDIKNFNPILVLFKLLWLKKLMSLKI